MPAHQRSGWSSRFTSHWREPRGVGLCCSPSSATRRGSSAHSSSSGWLTALGVAGREEKVAYYYNQMEHGGLAPSGVSDRVLDALAGIVDTTREALRDAGRTVVASDADQAATFARLAAPPPPEYADSAGGMARPGDTGEMARAERDEVDELFLDG